MAPMIARVWHGSTKPADADRYVAHLRQNVLPELTAIDGFRGLQLLRRARGDRVDFTVITTWDSLGAICGFAGADDYYDRAAAAHVIDRIARPTLVIHAANDPFIRILPETRRKIEANPNITFVEAEDGGHCLFVGERNGYDGNFAERAAVEFLSRI